MRQQQNIIEHYVDVNNGCVIFISGPIISKVSKLAKHLGKKFKFEYIDSRDYSNKKHIKFSEYNDVIDWNKLNNDLEEKKELGIIMSGFTFPTDYIKINPDYHIHLRPSKNYFINYKKEKMPMKDPLKEDDYTHVLGNKYNNYKITITGMDINKFIDIDDFTNRDIYEISFDIIIEFIQDNIK